MSDVVCPNCKTRVPPSKNYRCPDCGKNLVECDTDE